MKSITLVTKTEKVPVKDLRGNTQVAEVDINTLTYIRTAVENTPPGGFEVSDMITRLKLTGIIEDHEANILERKKSSAEPEEAEQDIQLTAQDLHDTVIQLEDDLFTKLGGYVNKVKWSFVSQSIVDFTELFVKTKN